ncbi:MAG: fibronectin type III domain-containing protein [Aeromicrobium sp.]
MNSRRWVALAFALTLAVAVAPLTGASAAPHSGMDIKAAKRLLPEAQQGSKALPAMSDDDVAVAAQRNGRSVENLRGLLSHDDTAWLSSKGRLFYVDRADAAQMATGQQQVPQSAAWTTYPDSLKLHSNAGSAHTAFLDFDGYTLPNGAGWTDANVGPTIPAGTYGGFSLDGSAAFSSAELTYIQTVWRIVSEKYAAFDIDVTTEAPSSDALNRTSAGDTTWGTRVVITNDMAARGGVCTANSGGGCVGIAWIDVFDAEQDFGYGTDGLEPAWVYTRFTSADPVFSAGSVANTAAHELGHTLGLDHDTTAGNPNGYYAGHDNWFPIMGSSNRAVGHFTNGTSYTGEFTYQVDPNTGLPNANDVDVIGKAGAPLSADDVAGTNALGSATSYSQKGIIERPTDTDTFSVTRTCTNTLTAAATGIGLGQAVDLKVTVRNPSNVAVATADPATSGDTSTTPNTPVNMDATATVANAGSGTWTITVEGVGLAGGTGYPDFGSIGMYQLDISGCPAGPTVPTAPGTPTATAGDAQATVTWTDPADFGDGAWVKWEVANAAGTVLCTQTVQTTRSCTVTGLTNGTTYQFKVRAVTTSGSGAWSPLSNNVTPILPPVAGAFVPLDPTRVLETRPAGNRGPLARKLTAGETVSFPVAGQGGVPPMAASPHAGAVVMNLTAVSPSAPGCITAYPSDAPSVPTVANLCFSAGQTVPNHVTVKIGAGGNVTLKNASGGTVDLAADVAGWYASGNASQAGMFTPATPTRMFDTRVGNVCVPNGKLLGDATLSVLLSNCPGGLDANAGAVAMNLTVADPGAAGFITGYPADAPKPTAANVVFGAHQTVANAATLKLGSGGANAGKLSFYNGPTAGAAGATHLVADLAGWFAPGAGTAAGAFNPVTPQRLLDTRNSTPVPAQGKVTLQVTGAGNPAIPGSGVGAAVFNVAAIGSGAPGYITAYPTPANLPDPPPTAANLVFNAGQTVGNLVTAKLSNAGKVTFYNGSGAAIDIAADITGWYKN